MSVKYNHKRDGHTAHDGAEDVYSKVVRAGRRTYFFDVKSTRADDWFLAITESRRMEGMDGVPYYEKHKIHLYKEDFEKYREGLDEIIGFIKEKRPDLFEEEAFAEVLNGEV